MYPIAVAWGFGISTRSAGLGEVYEYWVLGPLGIPPSERAYHYKDMLVEAIVQWAQ